MSVDDDQVPADEQREAERLRLAQLMAEHGALRYADAVPPPQT